MRCSRLQLVGAVLGAAWVALVEEQGGEQVVEGVRVLEDEQLVYPVVRPASFSKIKIPLAVPGVF